MTSPPERGKQSLFLVRLAVYGYHIVACFCNHTFQLLLRNILLGKDDRLLFCVRTCHLFYPERIPHRLVDMRFIHAAGHALYAYCNPYHKSSPVFSASAS